MINQKQSAHILSPLRRLLHLPQPRIYPVMKPTSERPARGTVLLSYLPECLTWSSSDGRLRGHSNLWQSRVIADLFNSSGYHVEAIRWDDTKFKPTKEYDIIFDISSNLSRLEGYATKRPILFLLRTGADAFFQNAAEMRRVREVEARRGVAYVPKRLVAFPDLEGKSLEMADVAALIGNEWTRNTYPKDLRNKLNLVPVHGSDVTGVAKTRCLVPPERNFMFLAGSGAVHKGLDLLLEVFARNPEHVLHVIGDFGREPDLVRAYSRELYRLPNIHCHGYLVPTDNRMKEILERCFCFIMPTCSEGSSPAAVTCMQLGLYPLISRECGVLLPDGCGRYLETCAIEEIETAVLEVARRPKEILERESSAVQQYAREVFSREAFRISMAKLIEEATASSRCTGPRSCEHSG